MKPKCKYCKKRDYVRKYGVYYERGKKTGKPGFPKQIYFCSKCKKEWRRSCNSSRVKQKENATPVGKTLPPEFTEFPQCNVCLSNESVFFRGKRMWKSVKGYCTFAFECRKCKHGWRDTTNPGWDMVKWCMLNRITVVFYNSCIEARGNGLAQRGKHLKETLFQLKSRLEETK